MGNIKTTAATIEQKSTAAITVEQVEAWKKQYGKVYICTTKDGKICYFKRPNRKIIAAAAIDGGIDNVRQKEFVVRNCWLGGDMDIQTDDKYFFALLPLVDSMIEIVECTLKEA